MPRTFFKTGKDVFETGIEDPISQEDFQGLGLNVDLLSEDPNAPTALGAGRDVETRSFIASGGELGEPSAAQEAGFMFDPTTGQLVTPEGTGGFGAGAVPTTEAITQATKTLFKEVTRKSL